MLRKKGEVHSREHQPEVDLPVNFVINITSDLAESEIEPGEYTKDRSHGQHVVKMGDDVIGIVKGDV